MVRLGWGLLLAGLAAPLAARETGLAAPDSLSKIARQIMTEVRYCTLITWGEDGFPHARLMDAFAPDDNLAVWLATNPRSRKVREISAHPGVTLFYWDKEGAGYVSLSGRAELVNDPEQKQKWWKEGWEAFYPNRDVDYLLIRVTPVRVEAVSYRYGLTGETETWEAPHREFEVENR